MKAIWNENVQLYNGLMEDGDIKGTWSQAIMPNIFYLVTFNIYVC
jgi:hypothetical protein